MPQFLGLPKACITLLHSVSRIKFQTQLLSGLMEGLDAHQCLGFFKSMVLINFQMERRNLFLIHTHGTRKQMLYTSKVQLVLDSLSVETSKNAFGLTITLLMIISKRS